MTVKELIEWLNEFPQDKPVHFQIILDNYETKTLNVYTQRGFINNEPEITFI